MFTDVRQHSYFCGKQTKMRNNYKRKTNLPAIREACLVWGLPGVAILAISLMVAVRVGSDFGHDGMVRAVTFIGSNALLWLLYALMFQMLPAELYAGICRKKLNRQPLAEVNTSVPGEEIQDESPFKAEANTVADVQTDGQPVAPTGNPDNYAMRCEQHRRQCEQEKADLVNVIIDYVDYIMPPYVDEENLTSLCGEIRLWTEDSTHRPAAIRLKGKLTTVDLRHFAWNIGERLGKENGYDGTARAVFIKAMFPDVFKDTEIESIKNFKLNPRACRIPIDEPEDGNHAFHYPYAA